MADIAKTLERARTELDADADARALSQLLVAWRAKRLPRIAEVIDRISERLGHEPLTAKTVKARTAKWIETAKKKESVDLGPLLATPWPGTWADALPVLNALVEIPDDPRVAMALAKIVDATPYDTWTSAQFYRPLLARLDKLADPRTLPILEADLERQKSRYWRSGTRPVIVALVEKLKRVYADGLPSLTGEEEAVLVAIEGLFVEEKTAEKAKAKGESEFLAAIYDAPDDDGVREVFADWLSERGDPRGELITLQIARATGRGTDEMARRESSLLKKYGKKWIGTLDRVLHKDDRVFERGFLAGAKLGLQGQNAAPPKELSNPALATLERLYIGWPATNDEALTLAILALPSLRWLRGVGGLQEGTASALAKLPPNPRLRELSFTLNRGEASAHAEGRALLVEGEAFPSLTHLEIDTDVETLENILGGALARRVTRITLKNYSYPIGRLFRLIERLDLPTEEVCGGHSYSYGTHWTFVGTRGADRRFTRLHCAVLEGTHLASANELESALATLDTDRLTELTVEAKESGYDEEAIRRLEARIATFTSLTKVDVPWERLGAADDTTAPATALVLTLWGSGVGRQHVDKLWPRVAEPPLSLSFDSYAVNYGGHTPLGGDGLAQTIALFEKKRTTLVKLYRKGRSETCTLLVRGENATVTSAYDEGRDGFARDYIAWLARLLDAMNVDGGEVPFLVRNANGGTSQRHGAHLAPINRLLEWIWIVKDGDRELMPTDELVAVARSFDFMEVVVTKRNAIVVFGRTPLDIPTKEQQVELQLALIATMWKAFAKKFGFVPRDVVTGVLGRALIARGFEEVPVDDPIERALGAVFYRASDESGARAFRIEAVNPMVSLSFLVEMRRAIGAPTANLMHRRSEYQWVGSRDAVATEKEARAVLEAIVDRLDEHMRWFSDRPASGKKRR